MYGAKSSLLYLVPTKYAFPFTNGSVSTQFHIIHLPAAGGVTLSQFFPPSLLTCINPSSLPVHNKSFSSADSVAVKMVQYTSTPVLSFVMGPPLLRCLILSLVVKSPLSAVQDAPSFSVANNKLPPAYNFLGLCGLKKMGKFH